MGFLIISFSFIVRQGFSLPLANVVSGSKAKENPEMPQMAGISAKSIYKRGFSWFIYHNSWKCHWQKYLHKKSLLILENIKIFQDVDHWSVFLALGIYLPFKKKGQNNNLRNGQYEKIFENLELKMHFFVLYIILLGNVLTDYGSPALVHLSQFISPIMVI